MVMKPHHEMSDEGERLIYLFEKEIEFNFPFINGVQIECGP